IFVGLLILERDPVVLTPQGSPAPLEPAKAGPKALFAPPLAETPEPPKTPPETTHEDGVEPRAAEAGKPATPTPRAATGKRPAKAKHNARPDAPRFLKGGRQTEIAKDFE
ncbi:MAG: hypothetical protein MUF54_13210, partial [Polyangiaceae bacterium]|nr:hypothetical protein [Polyangiaceae bacterium]